MNRPVGGLPGDRLEDELRAAFAEATADLPRTPDPWARTTRAVARSRVRRRAGGIAAVAVAAVAALVAVVHPPARRETQPAGPKVTAADVSTWPTRGNLAGRADLVAAVSAKAGDGGRRRVVAVPYLGTIDDVTAALVVVDDSSEPPDTRYVVLVYGRQSTRIDEWSIADASLRLTSLPVLTATFVDGEWSRGIAVTLSQGVSLAWSPRPFVERSGRTVRGFVPLSLDNGVGTWRTHWTPGLVTVRADWSGRRTILEPQIQTVGEVGAPGDPGPRVTDLAPSCARDPRYAELAATGLRGVWGEAAVPSASVTRIRLVWCGKVGTERAVLAGVATADGTDLQVLSEDTAQQGRHDLTASVWPVPAGRAMDYPMARELAVDAPRSQGRVVVTVVAPKGVLAQLEDAGGPFATGRRKLTADGFAQFALARADRARWSTAHPADLVIQDVRGQELDRVRAPLDDPWGKEIDGADATTDAPPAG